MSLNATTIDFIIALICLEAVALGALHRFTGHGLAVSQFIFNLLAGVCLLLALHASLQGTSWAWIATFLLASLVAHVLDLAMRWRRQARLASQSTPPVFSSSARFG